MTAARIKRKQYCAAAVAGFAAYAALLFLLTAAPPADRAAATERVVVDWHSGLAIGGYDPVAFFTDGKPVSGRAEFELRYDGTIWRFGNPGNRAAFAARPDIYMPQYGGYDPIGVARGLAVAGNPFVWLIANERLYLFYDLERRDTFAANPDRIVASANRKWPELANSLTP